MANESEKSFLADIDEIVLENVDSDFATSEIKISSRMTTSDATINTNDFHSSLTVDSAKKICDMIVSKQDECSTEKLDIANINSESSNDNVVDRENYNDENHLKGQIDDNLNTEHSIIEDLIQSVGIESSVDQINFNDSNSDEQFSVLTSNLAPKIIAANTELINEALDHIALESTILVQETDLMVSYAVDDKENELLDNLDLKDQSENFVQPLLEDETSIPMPSSLAQPDNQIDNYFFGTEIERRSLESQESFESKPSGLNSENEKIGEELRSAHSELDRKICEKKTDETFRYEDYFDYDVANISSNLFGSIKFAVCENVSHLDKVKKILIKFGAKFLNYLSDSATHFIADDPDHPSVSEAIDIYEKPVVASRWVWLSLRARKVLPVEPFFLINDEKRIFAKVKACPSQLSQNDCRKIWSMMTYYGGKFQLHLDSECTHLITFKTSGVKYDIATKNKAIKIVTPDWIIDSIRNSKLCDESKYGPKLLIDHCQNQAKYTCIKDRLPRKSSAENVDSDNNKKEASKKNVAMNKSVTMTISTEAVVTVKKPNTDMPLQTTGPDSFSIDSAGESDQPIPLDQCHPSKPVSSASGPRASTSSTETVPDFANQEKVSSDSMLPIEKNQYPQNSHLISQVRHPSISKVSVLKQSYVNSPSINQNDPSRSILNTEQHSLNQKTQINETYKEEHGIQSDTFSKFQQKLPHENLNKASVPSHSQQFRSIQVLDQVPQSSTQMQSNAESQSRQAYLQPSQVHLQQQPHNSSSLIKIQGSQQVVTHQTPIRMFQQEHQVINNSSTVDQSNQFRQSQFQQNFTVQSDLNQSQSIVHQLPGQIRPKAIHIASNQTNIPISQQSKEPILQQQHFMIKQNLGNVQPSLTQNVHSGSQYNQNYIMMNTGQSDSPIASDKQLYGKTRMQMVRISVPSQQQVANQNLVRQQSNNHQHLPRSPIMMNFQVNQSKCQRSPLVLSETENSTTQIFSPSVNQTSTMVRPAMSNQMNNESIPHYAPLQQVNNPMHRNPHSQQIQFVRQMNWSQNQQQNQFQQQSCQITRPQAAPMNQNRQQSWIRQPVTHQQRPFIQGSRMIRLASNVDSINQQHQAHDSTFNKVRTNQMVKQSSEQDQHPSLSNNFANASLVMQNTKNISAVGASGQSQSSNVTAQQLQPAPTPTPTTFSESAGQHSVGNVSSVVNEKTKTALANLLNNRLNLQLQQQQQTTNLNNNTLLVNNGFSSNQVVSSTSPSIQTSGSLNVNTFTKQANKFIPNNINQTVSHSQKNDSTINNSSAISNQFYNQDQMIRQQFLHQQHLQQQQQSSSQHSAHIQFPGSYRSTLIQTNQHLSLNTQKNCYQQSKMLNTLNSNHSQQIRHYQPSILYPQLQQKHVAPSQPTQASLHNQSNSMTALHTSPILEQCQSIHYFGHEISKIPIKSDECLIGCKFTISPTYLENPKTCKLIEGWKRKIEHYGGRFETDSEKFSAGVSHEITEHLNLPMRTFQQSSSKPISESKRYVTIFWLNDVIESGKLSPPWRFYHLPILFDPKTRPCKNHVIATTNFNIEERMMLKHLISKTGATFTQYLTKKNTVLICKKPEGKKYLKAIEYNLPIVNIGWLRDILFGFTDHVSANNLPKKYEIYNSETIDEDHDSKEIASEKLNQKIENDTFHLEYLYISHLMYPWRVPIKFSQEDIQKHREFLSKQQAKKETEKMRSLDPPIEISEEERNNDLCGIKRSRDAYSPYEKSENDKLCVEVKDQDEVEEMLAKKHVKLEREVENGRNSALNSFDNSIEDDNSRLTNESLTFPLLTNLASNGETSSLLAQSGDSNYSSNNNSLSNGSSPNINRNSEIGVQFKVPLDIKKIDSDTDQSSLSKIHFILLLGMQSKKLLKHYQAAVESLGGILVKNLDDAMKTTHLVLGRDHQTLLPKISLNFLCAFGRARYFLHSDWLDQSYRSNQFLPEQKYNFGFKNSFREDSVNKKSFSSTSDSNKNENHCEFYQTSLVFDSYGLDLFKSWSCRRADLFKNLIFLLTPSLIPSPSVLQKIIEANCGQAVLKKLPTRRQLNKLFEDHKNNSDLKVIVLTCENDLHLISNYFRESPRIEILSISFVIESILKQNLNYESFRLLSNSSQSSTVISQQNHHPSK